MRIFDYKTSLKQEAILNLVIVVRHFKDDAVVDVNVEDVIVLFALVKSFSVRQITLAILVRVGNHVPNFAPFAGCCFGKRKKE